MDPLAASLIQKESETLKDELKSLGQEVNTLARYAILVAAALFGLLLSEKGYQHSYDHILKWLPFVVNIFFVFALILFIDVLSSSVNTLKKY
jgi:hypothetical protein